MQSAVTASLRISYSLARGQTTFSPHGAYRLEVISTCSEKGAGAYDFQSISAVRSNSDGFTTTRVRREHHGQGAVGSVDCAGCVHARKSGGSFLENASCFSRTVPPPEDALVLGTRKSGTLYSTLVPVLY